MQKLSCQDWKERRAEERWNKCILNLDEITSVAHLIQAEA